MRSSFASVALVCATVVATAAILTVAGPLSPPAGPVSSTHKTLSQVEPRLAVSPGTTPGDAASLYRISQPGSYYLTGNISVPPGLNGITILADDVTIDLGGFVISSPVATGAGIISAGSAQRAAVHDGRVTGFGTAIDLLTAPASVSYTHLTLPTNREV